MYAMSWEVDNKSLKYESIQDSYVIDEYIDDEEVNEEEDFFGFAKSIEIDHLTDEEVAEVFNMFGDK